MSCCLQHWSKAYINNQEALPICNAPHKLSQIDDEGLASAVKDHLQSCGKYVCAQDIVDYSNKGISLTTAQRWMKKLGYHWAKDPKGQYVDGYECQDVVHYHQNIFLPVWFHYQSQMWKWKEDDVTVEEVEEVSTVAVASGCRVVVWFHDESTFYANDRRKQCWVHDSEGAVPQPKGEDTSLMVADFVSVDYGFLHSKDGSESVRVLFRAGKARDSFFTNQDITAHAAKAMSILEKDYPDEDHVLIFDNACTHLKRADDALSAYTMPKWPSSTWGVSISTDSPDGKPLKGKIHMGDGWLPNGNPQSLYFSEGPNNKAGWFKGMLQILIEHRYTNTPNLKAQCKDFKCPGDGKDDCCCHRLMYNQPDFANVESVLEASCCARNFNVIFLPKFHCELNFIEQCWSFAKQIYCMKDSSSSAAALEKNVIDSLDAVLIFSIRSARFIDAYQKGLNGTQAA
ncbi:hypothetical protein BDR04DRAFT_1126601 [Suillus decipiens]|nr:hypothetical protein BDR04DRAFT_1126601 [Suillus decipiens]